MKITSASLMEAATLIGQIEALQSKRDELNGQIVALDKEMGPLQSKFNSIAGSMGGVKGSRTVKCARGGKSRKFSDEQRAKISAGLKAKWAERNAAKAAQAAADTAPVGVSVSA